MTLFGMTTLGHPAPVTDSVAASHEYPFHLFEEEQYVQTFQKYLLGADSSIAKTLEIDGEQHILRAALGDMLRELLDRQPRKHELDAWFTTMDFDRTAVMDMEEFMRGVAMLREFSGNPQLPKEYSSVEVYRDHWNRHVRHNYELHRTMKGPVTLAQEIGWHAHKAFPKNREVHALNQTDVTLREGRNAASYYGHLICGNYDRRSKA